MLGTFTLALSGLFELLKVATKGLAKVRDQGS
jgi:hypothetical protein